MSNTKPHPKPPGYEHFNFQRKKHKKPKGPHVKTPEKYLVEIPKSIYRNRIPSNFHPIETIVMKSSSYIPVPTSVVQRELLKNLLRTRCSGQVRNMFSKKTSFVPCYSIETIKGKKYYKLPLFFCQEERVPYTQLKDLRKTPESMPTRICVKSTFQLREHQQTVHPKVMAALHTKPYHACTIQQVCGAGKTVQVIYAIGTLRVQTMVCVPLVDLARQFKEEMKMVLNIRDEDIGLIGGDFPPPPEDASIYICVYDSARKRQTYPSKFKYLLQKSDLLVIDEAHRFPAKQNQTILHNFHGKYRIGLTATPIRKSDKLGHMIFKLLGPIVAVVTREKPSFGTWKLTALQYNNPKHKKDMLIGRNGGDRNTAGMLSRLCDDPARTKRIAEFIVRELRQEYVLVLGDRKNIVRDVAELIETKIPNSTFVYVGGGSKSKDQIQKKETGLKHARFIVATTAKAGEAINIKRLSVVMFITPRSPGRLLIQGTGRMFRQKGQKHAYYVEDIASVYYVDKYQACCRWFEKEGFQIMPPRDLNHSTRPPKRSRQPNQPTQPPKIIKHIKPRIFTK